jgi:hypothetical protein
MVANARAYICNDGTLLDVQRGKHSIWLFFLDSFRARQPVGAGDTHHRRRLTGRLGLRSHD